MRTVRAAVVGTGFMGAVHSRSIIAAGGDLVAVVGSSPQKGRAGAEAFGAASGLGSLDAAFESGVDVVHVCTPNALHADFVRAALKAGCSVVCEKPLATDAATAAALTTLAAQSGLIATVPFVYRYYASVQEARARIQAPGATPPWLLHGSYLQDWLADPGATNWRVEAHVGGPSRAFADIGVHWCDLAEFVTGQRIVRVNAQFGRSASARPGPDGALVPVTTEDGATVTFTTDTGALGSVVISQASAGRKNALSFSFDGPDASYGFRQETPETLWIGGREANRTVARDPGRPGYPPAPRGALPAGHPQGYYECFTDFIADTYAALRGESVDRLPRFADGLRAARITEAVLASAASGTWIEVPTDHQEQMT
ncbi:Gfo/Idh/MocA family oxidoreductase [Streptomyces sp. NPDC000151]|uniref:Gfo/Idh/MocA family protein n=1 Tax=Streptomyces sp. NPDC000151 TaxID=3154244 RepID=UPI00332949BD